MDLPWRTRSTSDHACHQGNSHVNIVDLDLGEEKHIHDPTIHTKSDVSKTRDFIRHSSEKLRLRKSQHYRVIPEPVSGACVASILDEFARGSIRLQPEWEDDPEFYEVNEEQTDEKLFNLLLGDAGAASFPVRCFSY